jgi:tetratricopeptide (TPR) repeat protein
MARNTIGQLTALAGLTIAVWACARPVAGDVIVLSDGRRLEGIVTTSTLVPDVILFSDHVNKLLQVPRAKVAEVIREGEPVSRLKIARALAREGKYESALEQIREARRLAPNDPAIAEEEQTVLRALAIQSSKQAEVKADESRGLLDRIKQAMLTRQFDKALPLFATLEGGNAPAEVRDEAERFKIKFYDQWGDYRADKTDTLGAIECYEKAMDLDPNAADVYTKLMRLYERMAQPGANEARVQKLQEFLETRVTEDSKDLDARLRLANLLYMKKDWDNALQQYLTLFRDNATSHGKDLFLARVETRLRALLDGRHRKSGERRDYDLAIQQFREMQSVFPDVDTQPLVLYQYQKQAEQVGPKDNDARMELVKYCERYGLEDLARRELNTVLRNDPKHPEALRMLASKARADLAEIETAFTTGFSAQIQGLVAQFHEKYPPDRFPSLQAMNDTADDYIEKSRNEMRTQVLDKRKRAADLVQAGDQAFDRAMSALYSYRDGSGTDSRTDTYGRRVGGNVTISAGSYKTDAIMYFERALRTYREAQALDPTLGDAAKGDLRRKIADCDRYLSLLKSQRVYRLSPSPRSQRRTSPQYPNYGPYVYSYPYGYLNPYASPYGYSYPYGSYPYTSPYAYPYTSPYPYVNPYATPPPVP